MKRQIEEFKKQILDLKKTEEKQEIFIKELINPQPQHAIETENNKAIVLAMQENMIQFEKKIKNKYIIKEEILKNEYFQDISDKNSAIELYMIENEKLRLELKRFEVNLFESESKMNHIEFELKKTIDKKDREYEKLMKTLQDIQKETKDLDIKYSNEADDLLIKLKEIEELNLILKKDLNDKIHKLNELDIEYADYKEKNNNLHSSTLELKCKFDILLRKFENIGKENQDIKNEINKKENEIRKLNLNLNDSIKFKCKYLDLLSEKERFVDDNINLKIQVDQNNENINELNEFIEQNVENNQKKENNLRSNSEKINNVFHFFIKIDLQ